MALIIPGALGVWNIIITRTFFQINIPDELLKAAQIDGCSDIRFVVHVAMPLSVPVIAVQILMFAVGQWNSYFSAIVYIHKANLQPLQVVLRNILMLSSQFTWDLNVNTIPTSLAGDEITLIGYLLKYSLIVIASIPIMALYPFIQKYFIKGVLIGSLKG
jgi:ABC-type glycerol-3-phosphate transport system permease component